MVSSLFNVFQGLGQSITPLFVVVALVAILVLKKLFGQRKSQDFHNSFPEEDTEEILEPMKKRDFTLKELREYDGVRNKRVLMAVNGKVFDVSRAKNFYGPEGPYGRFAGHDASRGLATFSLEHDVLKDEYDDLSDLNSMQMDSLREWECQFQEKYDLVGRLLKPDESHQTYEDETEDEDTKSLKKD